MPVVCAYGLHTPRCAAATHDRKVCAVSDLSDYLKRHQGDRKPDQIVEEAARLGHSIDRTAVYAALRGRYAKVPREETLAALAAGFGLDVRELRRLAGKPAGELGPWSPPREASSLTQGQRDALDTLIRVIVREGGTDDGTSEAGEKTSGGVVAPRFGAGSKRARMIDDERAVAAVDAALSNLRSGGSDGIGR